MALVMVAALFMALLFVIFKIFDRRSVPLFPAIVINYFTAASCGIIASLPLPSDPLVPLVLPAVLLGGLFIILFYVTAISTQRIGVAVTSVATKMSLVVTVLVAVIFFHEEQSALGWIGIGLALTGVVLASWSPGPTGTRGMWMLPIALFLGNSAVDVVLIAVQRLVLAPATETVFITLVLGIAGSIGLLLLIIRGQFRSLRDPKAVIAGVLLGLFNYASLYFIIGAIARSGFAASSLFPMMNIGVILFGTVASIAIFQERLRNVQWAGIACSVLAMIMILLA